MNNIILNPCPFCGGNARFSVRRMHVLKPSDTGDMERYIVQVHCNRCRARGAPVKTDYVPFQTGGRYLSAQTEILRKWAIKAAFMWNMRERE